MSRLRATDAGVDVAAEGGPRVLDVAAEADEDFANYAEFGGEVRR